MKISTRQVAMCAMLTALALGLSTLENLFPVTLFIPLPGVKLGLANIVTVFALYQLGAAPALCILVARCLLGSLFAGNASALLFSLLGGTLAMLVMLALSRLPGLSVYGVSIGGAAGHNIGQMAAALITLGNTAVLGFAKQAIAQFKLGDDATPDLLNICLDTPRRISEAYGPESVEVEDMYYRLDRDLADFLTFVFAQVRNGEVLVVFTSDHGTIRVDNPVKVTGDRETSANLRYKTGRNLAYNSRDVYEILKPEDVQLPSSNLTSSYIFAYNSDFLVYNNDANRHIRYYRNTFQHGGISMEEMIVPYIVLKPKQ